MIFRRKEIVVQPVPKPEPEPEPEIPYRVVQNGFGKYLILEYGFLPGSLFSVSWHYLESNGMYQAFDTLDEALDVISEKLAEREVSRLYRTVKQVWP